MNSSKNKKFGFSILEVTIAIGIISIAMLGVISLVAQNMQVQNLNKGYIVASMLAQEGLELVRNIRDKNWLTPGNTWYEGISDQSNSYVFTIDYTGTINTTVTGIDNPQAQLSLDAYNYYVHVGGTAAPFFRLIKVDYKVTYLIVTSTVQWQDRGNTYKYEAETLLYEWR